MYDHDSKGISYSAGFFILIAFAIGALFLVSAISIGMWMQTGRPITDMADGLLEPGYRILLKWVQIITALIGFLLPALAAAWFLNKRPMKLLGFNGSIDARQVGLVLLIMGTALIVSSALGYLTELIQLPPDLKLRFDRMEEAYNDQIKAIVNFRNLGDYLIALIVMAFLPALGEEALFRGGLQNFLHRGTRNPWFAIIVVSILFSLAHFSFYGFLSRFFLGIVLGAIFYYSGKLWLSIIGHFVNNAIAVTVLYVSLRQGKSFEDAMKEDVGNAWGLLAIIIIVVLFFLFKKISSQRKLY